MNHACYLAGNGKVPVRVKFRSPNQHKLSHHSELHREIASDRCPGTGHKTVARPRLSAPKQHKLSHHGDGRHRWRPAPSAGARPACTHQASALSTRTSLNEHKLSHHDAALLQRPLLGELVQRNANGKAGSRKGYRLRELVCPVDRAACCCSQVPQYGRCGGMKARRRAFAPGRERAEPDTGHARQAISQPR